MRTPIGTEASAPPARCRVCDSENVWTFVEIREVPVHNNVLPLSHSQALRVPKGNLEMMCCRDCGHVYNAAFRSKDMEYCSDYENSLFLSEKYGAYATSLAADLIDRFDVLGKRVVEIGCGAGDFLKLLCEKGRNVGIGFDPSAAAGRSIERHPQVTFVRDYYSVEHANVDVDFLCCRHVLEHIELPLEFLRGIRVALPIGKKLGLFFEVPDVMFILKELSSWDLLYEHCSYFSMSSLHRLFTMCGFGVQDIWRTFEDQFLCVCAELSGSGTTNSRTTPDVDKEEVLVTAEMFSQVFKQQVEAWAQKLRFLEESKGRVVLWGAGSKGVTFLNILRGNGSIEYVVDINEGKQRKFIPGTGQRIVSPDFLKEYKPDVVILMNPAYEAEVRKTVGDMGVDPRFLIANQLDACGAGL